jgi:hypothetical protein
LWSSFVYAGFIIVALSIKPYVLADFSSWWQIPEESNLKEMNLFWLPISEVSICGRLVLCFWDCGEAVHYGGRVWYCRTVQLLVARKQKARMPTLVGFLLFPLLFYSGPAYGMLLPTFRKSVSPLVNPLSGVLY